MKTIVKIFAACALTMLLGLNANAYTQVSGFNGPTWYEAKASSFGGGSGSQSAPYMINTPEQLALLTYNVNVNNMSYEGNHFLIDLSNANIDLGKQIMVDGQEQTLNWVPIKESFKGTVKFKGQHFIKGMTIRAVGNRWGGPFYFGLFEILNQSISGARFSDVDFQISRDFEAGSLCARIDANSTVTIENSTATNVRILEHEGVGYVGGLVGFAAGCMFMHCTVTGALSGHICGGMVGRYNGLNYILEEPTVVVEDCHTATDINADSYVKSAGGLMGECHTDSKAVIQYCSTSGSITAPFDASLPRLGGMIGYLSNSNIENCSSAVSISGLGLVGGLAGYVLSYSVISNCFVSGGIELKNGQETSAGGFIGLLECNQIRECNFLLTECIFAGTFKYDKLQLGNMSCGSIVGTCAPASNTDVVEFLNQSDAFIDVYVDKNMCALPFCSTGTLEGIEEKLTKELASQEVEGEHVGYEYCYIMPRDIINDYAQDHGNQQVCFKDNFLLASIPFYVNEGKKSTSFCAYYITTPFTLAPLMSNLPGVKELAYFTLPNDITFVEYDDENDPYHVRPLDPGKAPLTVTHAASGLTRTIHLNIAYGEEWNDDEPSDIFAGDGTQNTPYLIQNASQLAKAAADPIKNREGAFFRLANDIFMNTHLIQPNEMLKDNAKNWTPVWWHANLDGNGKAIYGLYTSNAIREKLTVTGNGSHTAYGTEIVTYNFDVTCGGLFSVLSGNVHDLSIVDSFIYSSGYDTTPNDYGIVCGVMTGESKISRCMVHGIIDGKGTNGGIAGGSYEIDFHATFDAGGKIHTKRCGTIEDCFSCVHVEYGLSNYHTNGQRPSMYSGSGGGITGSHVVKISRCVATGKVENFTYRRGIGLCEDMSDVDTWFFDQQQMTTEKQSSTDRGELNTSEMIRGDILTDSPAWQHEKGRYPMLKQFAQTPYGDILSMPVHFAEGDRAGSVTKIFEFPTENVTWTATKGNTFVDLIGDCGAGTPMSKGSDCIYAETITAKSQSTKALRVVQIDTKPTGPVGIEFVDPKCEAAWKQVFGKGEDEVVTLRYAYEADVDEDGSQFNNFAKKLGVEKFPEMRYFFVIDKKLKLDNGVLSGLENLNEVELPKQLKSVGMGAFSGCSSLQTVEIPATTYRIIPGAFDDCSLTDIFVAPRNEDLKVRDHALFTVSNDLVVYPPARGETEVTISGTVAGIYDHAFYRIPQLETIWFDDSKPNGHSSGPSEDSFVHYDDDNGGMIDIYINDGTYDDSYDISNGGKFDGVLMKEFLQNSYWREYANKGHLHRYFPLTVNSLGWATMYIGFNTKLPKELKVYKVNKTAENEEFDENTTSVELKRISNLLHHTVPVVIRSDKPGLYKLLPYVGEVPEFLKYTNHLQGTNIGNDGRGGYKYGLDVTGQSDSNQGSVLTLGRNKSGTVGFFYYANPDQWLPPFKAFLYYNGNMESASKAAIAMSINDDMDEETLGVSDLRQYRSQSGSAEIYDLQGRKIENSQLQKGIYIINGRKVMVK